MLGDKKKSEKVYIKAFAENIIELQKKQQLIIGSINEAKNLLEVENFEMGENLELFKENINEAEHFLINNLSNEQYLIMIDNLLEKYSQSALLIYYKALYYERIGELSSALKYYKRVIEKSSKVEDAHYHMAKIFYKLGEKEKAILSYKRVLSISPENREIYKTLIEIYREANLLNKLCDEWLNIYSAQPNNKMLEEFLIIALHKAGRINEAKEILRNRE